MPITPKYTWSETDTHVKIVVETSGFDRSRVDVFATDCLLKVNAPPTYLLQLDLSGEIDGAKTTAAIGGGRVVFTCPKRSPGPWPRLEAEGSPQEIAERRERSVEAAHRRMEEAAQIKSQAKEKYERAMTDRSLDIDRERRLQIERRKGEELGAIRSDIASWQDGVGGEGGDESEGEEDLFREEKPMSDHPDYYGRGFRPSEAAPGPLAPRRAAPDDSEQPGSDLDAPQLGSQAQARGSLAKPMIWEGDVESDEEENRAPGGRRGGVAEEEDSPAPAPLVVRPLPPPRRAAADPVRIAFTPTECAHLPAREKREQELKEWKRKNLDPNEVGGDVSERQPLFLKDKGDALFAQENYLAAVNAYSRALELDPSLLPCWANRAACHLKLGNHGDCGADCAKVLSLCQPDLDKLASKGADLAGDAAARLQRTVRMAVKCLLRRATCYTAGGLHMDALMDAQRAYRYDRGPDTTAALEAARARLAAPEAAKLRSVADDLFRQGETERAVECYTAVLGLTEEQVPPPERAAAYANRAAAHFKQEQFEAAAKDSSLALAVALGAAGSDAAPPAEPLPAAGLAALEDRLAAALAALRLTTDVSPSSTEVSVAEAVESLPNRGTVCKALARRAACLAHLKRYGEALSDLASLRGVYEAGGEAAKAAAVRADEERIRGLQQGGPGRE